MMTQDDAFHSGAKPQEHLKGGMTSPIERMPNTSENMGNSRPASEPGGPSWNDQFRAPQPAKSGTNDKNKAH